MSIVWQARQMVESPCAWHSSRLCCVSSVYDVCVGLASGNEIDAWRPSLSGVCTALSPAWLVPWGHASCSKHSGNSRFQSIAKPQSRQTISHCPGNFHALQAESLRPVPTPLTCGPQLPSIHRRPSAATNSQRHQANHQQPRHHCCEALVGIPGAAAPSH